MQIPLLHRGLFVDGALYIEFISVLYYNFSAFTYFTRETKKKSHQNFIKKQHSNGGCQAQKSNKYTFIPRYQNPFFFLACFEFQVRLDSTKFRSLFRPVLNFTFALILPKFACTTAL